MFCSRRYWCRGARGFLWKLVAAILMAFVMYLLIYLWKSNQPAYVLTHCDPIDAVFTWVNGSDPYFLNSLRQFGGSYERSRFDDKNELKFSLRSLEMYAPWVRHVYIVTNGQIPKWLDLTYERVTIVPHEVLAPNQEMLPTFSSAAIETFLHRIPNLSRRFLYLNDDVFLGERLYPEDLYTDSEGVKIYQAWLVPDCAEDCPWTYIGDGACDRHCNIPQCQYDGDDCVSGRNEINNNIFGAKKSHKKIETKEFPKRKMLMASTQSRSITFRDILLISHKNLTSNSYVQSMVDSYNKRLRKHVKPKEILPNHRKINASRNVHISNDVYLQSLIHTNMVLNRRYGFKARHVISHVGFLLDKSIIEGMHSAFTSEVSTTSAHRFRSSNDLQFSFAYYSFVMEETSAVSVADIFDQFDTDHSQTWSDREIRTFLTKTFPLPLDWSAVKFFEEVVRNCCLTYCSGLNRNMQYTTILYERYEDSNLPTISYDFVKNCNPLVEALTANFGSKSSYKYHINPKRSVHNNFFMLTSNVTDVVNALDIVRRTPRKFNCINDNLDPNSIEENDLIRHLLEDFFLSLFPHQSKFELQPHFRNRFENWKDYVKWRRKQRAFLIAIYGSCILSVGYIIRSICKYKAKLVSRCVNAL